MSKAHLTLYFTSFENPELIKSIFITPERDNPIVGVRGVVAPRFQMPFRWSPLVQTICIFFLRALIFDDQQRITFPILSGDSGTPAAMLGALANRSRENLAIDLFGSDRNGRPNILRIIACLNYRRRLVGPIEVYYKSTLLDPADIVILVGQENITADKQKLLAIERTLADTWRPGNMDMAREQRKRA